MQLVLAMIWLTLTHALTKKYVSWSNNGSTKFDCSLSISSKYCGDFYFRLFDMGVFSIILVITVIVLVQYPAVNGDLFQHLVSNLQCSKRWFATNLYLVLGNWLILDPNAVDVKVCDINWDFGAPWSMYQQFYHKMLL